MQCLIINFGIMGKQYAKGVAIGLKLRKNFFRPVLEKFVWLRIKTVFVIEYAPGINYDGLEVKLISKIKRLIFYPISF